MSYIKEIEPDEATGETKAVYDFVAPLRGGRVPPILKVMGLNPKALRGFVELTNAIGFGGSHLGKRREEMIATFVSTLNRCYF